MHARDALSHVRTWVFDLDHTLYPADGRLFDQIERRMTEHVMRELGVDKTEADRLRALYWREHGTTLAGLMAEHGMDPGPFLSGVHDVDVSVLDPDPALREAILALPGRSILYTNGTVDYAERVLEALGLAGVLDALYGVEEARLVPKPQVAAYEAIRDADGFAPASAAMFEDSARNLEVPHAWGMGCVLVGPEGHGGAPALPHVHHATQDLTTFLRGLG